MRDIDIGEFKKLLEEKGDDLEIIDVREPDEFEVIRLKDSKLIPMMGIQNRINEIDWNKTVILVCRSGARSAYVGRNLDSQFEVLNLWGGLAVCYQDKDLREKLLIDEKKILNYF